MHCTENSKQIFPEMNFFGLVPNFYIHLSVGDLYMYSQIVYQTQYSKIGRLIVRMCELLTDTRM